MVLTKKAAGLYNGADWPTVDEATNSSVNQVQWTDLWTFNEALKEEKLPRLAAAFAFGHRLPLRSSVQWSERAVGLCLAGSGSL